MASNTPRRMLATCCLALTATLAVPAMPAHAAPKPSASEIKKKLTKLNEQVDGLVEKFNQLNEDLKTARAKLKAAKAAAAREKATFEDLRKRIVEMAASAYKQGDMGDVTTFIGSDDPQAMLDKAAVMTQLSRNRGSQLAQFLSAAQRVQREQAQAQDALNQVSDKVKKLRDQKADVDKAIKEQKKLLAKAGGGTGGGSGGGGGGTYNGPATGNAKKALDFAYAQLGKAYRYGAAGPSNFDCSGLTMRAWGAAGVNLPRTTYSQYAATKRVAFADLQPGDLVFFSNNGHMGIYAGGGKMVHAPHTGDVVRVANITSGYYRSAFYGAGRP